MTVFSTAEVAARRSTGFTIDSLIGKDKDTVKNDRENSRSNTNGCSKAVVNSSSTGIHRPTPIVSGSSVPRRACSPCSQVSAVNLSVSPVRDLPRDHPLNSSPGHTTERQHSPGHIPASFGLNLGISLNYLDPGSPLFLRRGLPVAAHSGSPLWTHHPHGLHRHLPSLPSSLLGRLNPLRPSGPPLSFPHPSAVPFHPALVGAPRDIYPPYPWNVAGHESFPIPHIPGPGAGLFFHAFRKPKRHRTAFSPSQLLKLEQAFDRNQYVVGQERKKLAEDLNLSETQVKVWFQNRRTKFKRVKAEDDEEGPDDISEDQPTGDNKVSHHVTRWKMETNQMEVDSEEEDEEGHEHSSGIHQEYVTEAETSS